MIAMLLLISSFRHFKFCTFGEVFLVRIAGAFEVDQNVEQRTNSPTQPSGKGTVVPKQEKRLP